MIEAIAARRFNSDGRYFEPGDRARFTEPVFVVLEGLGMVRRPVRKKIAA